MTVLFAFRYSKAKKLYFFAISMWCSVEISMWKSCTSGGFLCVNIPTTCDDLCVNMPTICVSIYGIQISVFNAILKISQTYSNCFFFGLSLLAKLDGLMCNRYHTLKQLFKLKLQRKRAPY